MPGLVHLKLTDRLACQGSQAVYGVLPPEQLTSAGDVHAIEDQESLTFRFSRVDETGGARAITAQLRAGRIITATWDDGSFDEWRVGAVTMGRGEGGLITVVCVALWLDLVERADAATGRGWVSDLSNGVRNFDFIATERTPSAILSTYVIPNCPSWVALGTVDPTYVIPDLPWSRLTPGGLAILVRDTLRAVDVACELRLRQNGTSGYLLDLVTQIGASGATPVFHPANSLLGLQQKADPTLQATRILVKGGTAPDGLPGIWGRARWRGAAPSGLAIALSDRNGGSSPVAFDGQFVGMYLLRVKTGRTFLITASSAAAGTVTLGGGVSTIAVDEDFEFRLDEPLTNTRTTTTRYAVSAIPDGTHLTSAVGAPITIDGQFTDWYARVWNASSAGAIVATTRITGSVAATDVIAVASSAGVTTAHFIEFVQLDGDGEIPSYVDHPTYIQPDPVGYGVKAMELAKPQLGVAQLVKNGWLRAWAASGSPPDGYTVTGTGTFSRNASPAYTRHGGYSWAFSGALSSNSGIYAPPVYLPGDTGYCSVRALVYFTTFNTQVLSQLEVSPATPAGAPATGSIAGIGSPLYTAKVGSLDYVATPQILVDTGTWVELTIKGIPVTPGAFPYGLSISYIPAPLGAPVVGYLDSIECYPFAECPSLPTEFGDATGLLQAANNQLRLVGSPPLFYTFTIRDLERAFPDEYARLAVTLGANARAADVEYGIDTTVRVLRIERDLLAATVTTLTLANRPAKLTSLLSEGAANTRRVVAAVAGGQTAASAAAGQFATVSGSVTLPEGTEIATSSGTTGLIAMGPNSSIVLRPLSATSPTTVVTVGTPPSRERPPVLPNF